MNIRGEVLTGLRILRANFTTDYKVPLSVYLSLADRCPNACRYCNYYMLEDNVRELTTEEIIHLLKEMDHLGTRRLQLTGGEPMVRKDIGRIISFARDRGIFTGVSTSGLLVPEKIDELKGVNVLFLSLDGEEETHDFLRGEGSFQTVMKAMDALKSRGMKFWTTTVITKKNILSIDYILELAKKRGFLSNYVLLYHEDHAINNLPPSDRVKDLMLSNKEIREVVLNLLERKKRGEPVGSSTPYLEFLLHWEDYSLIYSTKRYKGVRCWAGRLSCHINTEGLLYACGPAMGIAEGQDVKILGLEEAFRRAKSVPSCNSCIHGCWLESNLLFSLNASSIWNWFHALRD